MKLSVSASGLGSVGRATSRTLQRWFPTPALIYPHAAGIDISDASVKWLAFSSHAGKVAIETWGEQALPEGIVKDGIIQDVSALAQVLGEVKHSLGGIGCAHAALPEEPAYVFSMHVPEGTAREEILHMIEFEFEGRVPIPPSAAIFDYDVIQTHDDGQGEEIAVVVFPRELSESYAAAFELSGIALLSLELEARSIARAVSSLAATEPVTLLVDFGRARTGFAVLKRGFPIFTSTVDVGGDAISRTLMEKFSLSSDEAIVFRNEQGLQPAEDADKRGLEAVTPVAAALSDEINRHYHYWDTRRNEHGARLTPVGEIILVGGSANLEGLAEYVAGRVQAPTSLGAVWRHAFDFDRYIPAIDRRMSMQYATAVGLALRALPV